MTKFIFSLFIIIFTIFFSSCAQKNNCISGYNVYFVNWGNGMGMQPVFTPKYSHKACK